MLAAAALVVLAGLIPATASPDPVPWSSWDYDFGLVAGSHQFGFINVYTRPVVDKPFAFAHPSVFHITSDSCTHVINPGQSCSVVVNYTPSVNQLPVTDLLHLAFTMDGAPISTPGVTLFAAGAEYVSTDFPVGQVVFPSVVNGFAYELISFHLHGPWPVDEPPDLLAPWSVVSNTCVNLPPGSTACAVNIRFQSTVHGSYSVPFQMTFEDPGTGQPVTVQPLTLYETVP